MVAVRILQPIAVVLEACLYTYMLVVCWKLSSYSSCFFVDGNLFVDLTHNILLSMPITNESWSPRAFGEEHNIYVYYICGPVAFILDCAMCDKNNFLLVVLFC